MKRGKTMVHKYAASFLTPLPRVRYLAVYGIIRRDFPTENKGTPSTYRATGDYFRTECVYHFSSPRCYISFYLIFK